MFGIGESRRREREAKLNEEARQKALAIVDERAQEILSQVSDVDIEEFIRVRTEAFIRDKLSNMGYFGEIDQIVDSKFDQRAEQLMDQLVERINRKQIRGD